MKKIMIGVLCLLSIQCFAQDTTKAKPKAWLGVLTLTEKYKTEANWTGQDQGIVGEHFQRLIKMKEAGKVLDLALLDHLIVSERGYYSFADEGII